MKVLFVIDSLGAGGAERSTAAMLPYLRDRGVECSVATLYRAKEGSEEFVREQGFTVTVLGGSALRQVRELRQLIRFEQPDVVHTALWTADQIGRLAAWRTSTKVLSSLVNIRVTRELVGTAVAPWKLRVVDLIDASTRRWLVDWFHAVSPGVAKVWSSEGSIPRDRILVAERGRTRHGLGERTADRRARLRAALGVDDETPVIVAAARLERQKALPDLVAAHAKVRESLPNVVTLIAGRDGNAAADVRAAIDRHNANDGVHLLGHRTDVADLLSAADVMALSSHFEGNSGTVIEAMGLGMPIASSRLAGQEGVLVHDRNALLHEPGDVAGLAANLIRLLVDRSLVDRLGSAARADFDTRFEMSAAADRQLAMYRVVTDR